MRMLIRYFAISTGVQLVVLPILSFTGFGGVIIYVFYLFPWVYFGQFSSLPKQIFNESSFLLVFAVPVLAYSLVVATVTTLVKSILQRSREKSARAIDKFP